MSDWPGYCMLKKHMAEGSELLSCNESVSEAVAKVWLWAGYHQTILS